MPSTEAGEQRAEPRAQRTRLRPPARLTAGSVVPVVLAVLAAGFAYEALQDRSSMTSIVVASSVLPVGAPVDSQDTRAVRVHSSDTAVAQGLLTPSQLDSGWVAAVEVRVGEPVTMSEVEKSSAVPALGEMSIAVPVQQAAGGRIGAGDLVDVIASNGSGGAYYVAQSLRVLGVAPTSAGTGVLDGGTGSYFIVVAVNKLTALRIAAALGAQEGGSASSDLEIVRSSGEAPTAQVRYGMPAPQVTQSTASSAMPLVSRRAGTGAKGP
jgi:Flp pilus assembly protein CpaB